MPVSNPFPPPWELGPGPADPALSAASGSYTGSGYGPIPQGKVGIGVGNPITVPLQGSPAQLRFFLGTDGNLYALDNKTNTAYIVSPTAAVPPPSVYSPTK